MLAGIVPADIFFPPQTRLPHMRIPFSGACSLREETISHLRCLDSVLIVKSAVTMTRKNMKRLSVGPLGAKWTPVKYKKAIFRNGENPAGPKSLPRRNIET
jgi:hypothetical protein